MTDIAALRTLMEKAYPGEWWVDEEGTTVRLPGGDYVGDFDEETDRELAVAAHNALPSLLTELEAARKVCEAARDYRDHLYNFDAMVAMRLDKALAAHEEACK